MINPIFVNESEFKKTKQNTACSLGGGGVGRGLFVIHSAKKAALTYSACMLTGQADRKLQTLCQKGPCKTSDRKFLQLQ